MPVSSGPANATAVVPPRRPIVVLDAPSNLGLNPPQPGSVPGCYKLSWALRDRGLLSALGAFDGGCVIPPRYEASWEAGDGDRNAASIATYSVALSERLAPHLREKGLILVLGGDCSVLIGVALALKAAGRFGLVFLDAHSDFRHPGNTTVIGAAAGEDLAIVTGRGDRRLINLHGLGPYLDDRDIHVVGVRQSDEHLDELASLGIAVTTSAELKRRALKESLRRILSTVDDKTDGFWIHLDLDVVDASEMASVDCPEPGGPTFDEVAAVLAALLASPRCRGMHVTIYDPDLDPDGRVANKVVEQLVRSFDRTHGEQAAF